MERNYIVPLRKEYMKAPIHGRTSKAIRALKQFIQKHMKVEEIKIGPFLNQEMWKNGNRNPPHKVEVRVEKTDNICKVELTSAPKEEIKEPKKKEEIKEPKKKEEIKEEKIPETPEEEKAEKFEEEKKEVLEKEELKKEKPKKEQPKSLKKEDQEKVREEHMITKDLKRKK